LNPQDPLANLHPLRTPPPIDWWPPAPGWWVLGVLVLVTSLALAWYLIRRYRANAYRRRALAQLAQLAEEYQRRQDELQFLADTNALLKSVALVAYPRRDVAARSGEAWLTFLNSQLKKEEQFPSEFVTGAYQKSSPGIDMARLRHCATAWIRQHEVAP